MRMKMQLRLLKFCLLLGAACLLFPSEGEAWGKKKKSKVQPYGSEALDAFAVGDYQSAIDKYSKAIEQDGDRYEYYFKRAESYEALGNESEALADFSTAIGINPDDTGKAVYGRGKILYQLDEYRRALPDFERVVEMDSGNALARLYLGLTLYELRRYDEAEDDLSKALPGLPSGSEAILMANRALALSRFRQDKFEEAFELYINGYYRAKAASGGELTDEDHYVAGALADVNLDEAKRDSYWSRVSVRYKKDKGIE